MRPSSSHTLGRSWPRTSVQSRCSVWLNCRATSWARSSAACCANEQPFMSKVAEYGPPKRNVPSRSLCPQRERGSGPRGPAGRAERGRYRDHQPGERAAGTRTGSLVPGSLPEWSHLDPGGPREWMSGSDLDGRIQVGAFHYVIASDLLLGFGKRPVGDQQLAVVDTYDSGFTGRAERAAVQPAPALAHVFNPRLDGNHHGRVLIRRRLSGLIDPEHQHVLHGPSNASLRPCAVTRRGISRHVDIGGDFC